MTNHGPLAEALPAQIATCPSCRLPFAMSDADCGGCGTPRASLSATKNKLWLLRRLRRLLVLPLVLLLMGITAPVLLSTRLDANDGGITSGIRDRAEFLTEFGAGAAAAAELQEASLPPMNILLMGVDARPGEAIDIGVRPDALAVLHLDPDTGACRLLSIPRDSRTELPGYGLSKIDHALAVGGIPFERLVVAQFLGIAINRYALIDFSGVTELVDAVGGITITVTEPFTIGDYTFAVGQQTLDGAEALAYSRYRGGPDGDFGRERRQQQVLRALMSQTAGANAVKLVTDLLPIVNDHFRTDLSPAEMVALAARYRATCTGDTIDMMSLSGTVATFDDPIFHMPLSYVVIDETEVQQKVKHLTTGAS